MRSQFNLSGPLPHPIWKEIYLDHRLLFLDLCTINTVRLRQPKRFLIEKQFTSHDLCDENREWRVEARVHALTLTVYNNPTERVRPRDQEINKFFKLRKTCETDIISNECLKHIPRAVLACLTHLITAFGSHTLRSLWKDVTEMGYGPQLQGLILFAHNTFSLLNYSTVISFGPPGHLQAIELLRLKHKAIRDITA